MNPVYYLNPTPEGFTWASHARGEESRRLIRPLYPEGCREDLFTPEQMKTMSRHPNRPVACPRMVPKYYIDLNSAAGVAGFGRFAAVKGAETLWLDEFQHVETDYANGKLRYRLSTPEFSGRLTVELQAAVGTAAMLVRVDGTEFDPEAEIYWLHGGMTGLTSQYTVTRDYERNFAWNNVVMLHGDWGEICLDGGAYDYAWEGLEKVELPGTGFTPNDAFLLLPDWKRQIFLRAEGAEYFSAGPDALISFHKEECARRNVLGGTVCLKLPAGQCVRGMVGRGRLAQTASFDTLFALAEEKRRKLTGALTVHSGITELDSVTRIGAYESDALFADNVFVHGALSWRLGYIGWRSSYGPMAYGMMEQARSHFLNNVKYCTITEGRDRGCLMFMIELGKPDAMIFYNMYETFLDQARTYWEYTGDRAFGNALAPVLEGCMEREIRCLKPGTEWVFENSLNTWISDSHWSIMGQCAQASAYMYSFATWAAELVPEKREYYRNMAADIYADTHRLLWQKRKGVFAYCRDTRGNRLLHPEPELADVYHTAEFGLASPLETLQMLDWVEANLKKETADNGSALYWSARWKPNLGNSFTHSTYDMVLAENLNLALTYFSMGMAEEGYELFKSCYMDVFGGRIPEEDRIYVEEESVVIGGFSCKSTRNGTPRGGASFADTTGMFGRTLYEGLLGIRPMRSQGKLLLAPTLPREIPKLQVESALLDYDYHRRENAITLGYRVKAEGMRLVIRLHLQPVKLETVLVDGVPADVTVEPDFDGIRLTVTVPEGKTGELQVAFRDIGAAAAKDRLVLMPGDGLRVNFPDEEILSAEDPQGVLERFSVENHCLRSCVGPASGSGILLLTVRKEDVTWQRIVRLMIPEPRQEPFRSPAEEFTAPLEWVSVSMDGVFNAGSAEQILDTLHRTCHPVPEGYSDVNREYYRLHIRERVNEHVASLYHDTLDAPIGDARWKTLIGEDGIAVTGEGIPFRSVKSGNYLAATSLATDAYPASVTVPVGQKGRAVYLLAAGITFPMQSHVENVRVTLRYEDGSHEAFPLICPRDISNTLYPYFGYFHDTPGAGFENMGGRNGPMSSAGQNLNTCIPTDTEAHILRFRLKPGEILKTVTFETVCQDAAYCLMGVTVLK